MDILTPILKAVSDFRKQIWSYTFWALAASFTGICIFTSIPQKFQFDGLVQQHQQACSAIFVLSILVLATKVVIDTSRKIYCWLNPWCAELIDNATKNEKAMLLGFVDGDPLYLTYDDSVVMGLVNKWLIYPDGHRIPISGWTHFHINQAALSYLRRASGSLLKEIGREFLDKFWERRKEMFKQRS